MSLRIIEPASEEIRGQKQKSFQLSYATLLSNELHTFHHEFVFIRELAQKLGCNPTNLADKLISAGLLPVHGPSIDGGLVYVFRRKAVEALDLVAVATKLPYRSRCGRGHTPSPSLKNDNRISSLEACRFLNVRPGQLDKLCQLGFLTPRRSDDEHSNLFFELTELEDYLNRYRRNEELIEINDAKAFINEQEEYSWKEIQALKLINPINDGITDYYDKHQFSHAIEFRKSILSTKQLSFLTKYSIPHIRWEARRGCLIDMIVKVKSNKYYFHKQAIEKLMETKISCQI